MQARLASVTRTLLLVIITISVTIVIIIIIIIIIIIVIAITIGNAIVTYIRSKHGSGADPNHSQPTRVQFVSG